MAGELQIILKNGKRKKDELLPSSALPADYD